MRAVLDTNVLLSVATANRVRAGVLWQIQSHLREGAFELVLSEPIITELERNLDKPYFTTRLSPEIRQRFIVSLMSVALIQPVVTRVHGVATHAEDDLILATAVDANADVIVTGDKALQSLGRFHGVAIFPPTRFAALLGASSRPTAA